MKERQKVQVWIHRKKGAETEVLLLFTRPGRGEFWQPVTGSVEAEEALDAAALREATEETGLHFLSNARSLGHFFEFEARGEKFVEHCYEIEAGPGAVTLDPHEHTAYRWMAPREALALVHHRSNAEALELLLRSWSRDTEKNKGE